MPTCLCFSFVPSVESEIDALLVGKSDITKTHLGAVLIAMLIGTAAAAHCLGEADRRRGNGRRHSRLARG